MKKILFLLLLSSTFSGAMKPQKPSFKLDSEGQREFMADINNTLCTAGTLEDRQTNKAVAYYQRLQEQLKRSPAAGAFEEFFNQNSSRITELYAATIADSGHLSIFQEASKQPSNTELWNIWRNSVSKKLITNLSGKKGVRFPNLPKTSNDHLIEFLRMNHDISSDAVEWLAPCAYIFYIIRQLQRQHGPMPMHLPFDKN